MIYSSAMIERRQDVAEFVKRWGCSASVGLLDPTCKIFITPYCEGMIGYRIRLGCAVVLGDPVCSSHDLPILLEQFHCFTKVQGWKVIYVVASKKFANLAMEKTCKSLIEFGEELILDPYDDPLSAPKGHMRRVLRNKFNKSIREGVSVCEYTSPDPILEHEMEQVGISWLKARKGLQIYLAKIGIFTNRPGKRWFYAKQGDRIVGVLLLNQLEAAKGWLLNLVMVTPEASSGTSESLIISALHTLRNEGCRYFSFGAAPSSGLGEIKGLSKMSAWIIRKVFNSCVSFFHLDNRTSYWKKFQPRSEPSYLLFEEPHIGIREILSIMHAFNVGSSHKQLL